MYHIEGVVCRILRWLPTHFISFPFPCVDGMCEYDRCNAPDRLYSVAKVRGSAGVVKAANQLILS